jgi:hypothetical protein
MLHEAHRADGDPEAAPRAGLVEEFIDCSCMKAAFYTAPRQSGQ